MELIKPIQNIEYENMWIKCFRFINMADTIGLRINNYLQSPIKYRIIWK